METLLNDFSVGLFAMQAAILVILIVLMRKFAWKPILDALQSREEGIQNALDSAEKAKLEMENLTASNEKLLQEARIERDGILKEAREMKDNMIATAKEEAQAQVDSMIAQAQEAIVIEKKAALAELKSHVASISIEMSEKVMQQELSNKDKQLALVNTMLSEAKFN
ncbi:F0F1 ATP synthase subunit B [Gelatiniphilus marinus]|uniref:ATP synthase subunit b n=1 Tax=Gelatiniphilus marinus TaxID=1759464 RepID=A0ABW5JTQ3_9FLAO